MNRFFLIISTTFLGLVILSSCEKDDESTAYTEPIAVLQPSQNPQNIVKGDPIKYDVRFTNDEYIDSVMVSYQLDSTGAGYNDSISTITGKYVYDSLINKVVYPIGGQSNEQQLTSSFTPLKFPPVGKKIYLVFRLHSDNRKHEKIVSLIVS